MLIGGILLGVAVVPASAVGESKEVPNAGDPRTRWSSDSEGVIGEKRIYKRVEGRPLHVFVLRPENHPPDSVEPRPVMVFFHGGGWVAGSPRVFSGYAEHFRQRGVICVLVEYRLLDRAVLDAPLVCIQDAKSAMRWVRQNAKELGADPERVASFGASAGGHLAAAVGMLPGLDDPDDDLAVSARAQAMLMLNPVLHNGPGEAGYGYKRTGEAFPRYSPFHNVSPEVPPALVMIGTEDKLIPLDMVLRFKRAMEQAGVRCDVEAYHGEEHSFFSPNNANGLYFSLTTEVADRFLSSLGWIDE